MRRDLRDKIIYMIICSINNENWEDVRRLSEYLAHKENLNWRMFYWVSMRQKEETHNMVENFFKERED